MAWSIEAAAILVFGFVAHERAMRLSGLLLLATCIVKLFAIDFRELDAMARIISFIVLGLLLVAASWVYTRYRDQLHRYLWCALAAARRTDRPVAFPARAHHRGRHEDRTCCPGGRDGTFNGFFHVWPMAWPHLLAIPIAGALLRWVASGRLSNGERWCGRLHGLARW